MSTFMNVCFNEGSADDEGVDAESSVEFLESIGALEGITILSRQKFSLVISAESHEKLAELYRLLHQYNLGTMTNDFESQDNEFYYWLKRSEQWGGGETGTLWIPPEDEEDVK